MSSILHHLAALGWGWVALLVAFDAVAVACATLAIVTKKRRRALWALAVSGGALVSSIGVTALAVTMGLSAAFGATRTGSDPSKKAAELAGGISEAMNGVVFGMLTTFIACLATLVCAIGTFARNRNSPADGR